MFSSRSSGSVSLPVARLCWVVFLISPGIAYSKKLRGANNHIHIHHIFSSTDVATASDASTDAVGQIHSLGSTDIATASDASTDAYTDGAVQSFVNGSTDLSTDGTITLASDTGTDHSMDFSADASMHASADSSMDVSAESSLDTVADLGVDAYTDVASGVDSDHSLETYTNLSMDATADLHAEAYTDAESNGSSDASMNLSADAFDGVTAETWTDVSTELAINTSSDAFTDLSTDSSALFPAAHCMERPTLYIGVSTSPTSKSQLKRTAVRQTWMNYNHFQQTDCIQAKFFVGNEGLDPDVSEQLEAEARENDDIIFLPLHEHYDNLANKTVTMLKWFAANTNARMVMKLDEDTFPHMNAILSFLQHQPAVLSRNPYVYMGSFMWKHPVLHSGKWAESDAYTSSFYPPFADGPGYLLSSELVKKMAEEGFYNATADRMLHNEDANVGQMLSQIPQTSLVKRVDVKATQWGCNKGDLFSMQLGENHFQCMWETFELGKSDDDICCPGYKSEQHLPLGASAVMG